MTAGDLDFRRIRGLDDAAAAEALSGITGFTLRIRGGALVPVAIPGTLESEATFPAAHLYEHMAAAAPVRQRPRITAAPWR